MACGRAFCRSLEMQAPAHETNERTLAITCAQAHAGRRGIGRESCRIRMSAARRQARPQSSKRPAGAKSLRAPRTKAPAPARVATGSADGCADFPMLTQGCLTRRIASARLSALDRRLMTELFWRVGKPHLSGLHRFQVHGASLRRRCDAGCPPVWACINSFSWMRIPENAACNDAVELTRRFRREEMSGLVNAVLRGLVRDRSRIIYPKILPSSSQCAIPSRVGWWICSSTNTAWISPREMISFRDKQHDVTIRPNLLKMDASAFEKYLTDQGFDWEKSRCAWRLSRARRICVSASRLLSGALFHHGRVPPIWRRWRSG